MEIKMMHFFIYFTLFIAVQCDLLDLYVQHMDETSGTNVISKTYHPRDIGVKLRNKRSPKEVNFAFGHFKKQRLDVDDDWWMDKTKMEKPQARLPISKADGLAFTNMNERNNDPNYYEFIQDKSDIETTEDFGGRFDEQENIDESNPVQQVLPTVQTLKNEYEDINSDVEMIENIQTGILTEVLKKSTNRTPKKYNPMENNEKSRQINIKSIKNESTEFYRHKRNVKTVNFTRHEILDNDGDVLLEWDPSDEEIVTFRVTAKTLGYIGIGFNGKNHMKGADILIAWVDDHTGEVNLLDSHGDEAANASPITDLSQDIKVLKGIQNDTHTVVTFSRNWQTCDPDDRPLTEDNVRVLWAMHESDPELNTPVWHGERRGGRAVRLKASADRESPPHSPDVRHWDVKLNQFAIDDKQDTIYWCKIFKAPPFNKKHHMIGYEPLVEKDNEALVHHMILYECASTSPILGQHARIVGAPCYSVTMPREWDSCIQPVVAWARGSKGEWLGDHVGIPVAEHREGSYYMLEVHYNNPMLKKAIDSSGLRLHLTPALRPQEAGIFVTGVAVSPLHLIPPQQKAYATAGYCTSHCTDTLFPDDGVNVVSVLLHSHLAGRRLSLKHIRDGRELPNIVHENQFDFDYQQSHSLENEVKILPGDELITECVYGTQDRTRPTLGGYAASQEMCLAFVVYYPRTELAGCYSMTPAKDLFKTLGVVNFKGVTLDNLEKLFLTTGTDAVTLPTTVQHQLPVYPATRPSEKVDEEIIKDAESALKAMKEFSEQENEDNVFARLVIEDPEEFRGRTLAEHMLALPWSEALLTKSIENSLYQGRHMTFCRKRDDKLALPADIQTFPNFTKLPEANVTVCHDRRIISGAMSPHYSKLLISIFVVGFSIFVC